MTHSVFFMKYVGRKVYYPNILPTTTQYPLTTIELGMYLLYIPILLTCVTYSANTTTLNIEKHKKWHYL